MTSLRSEPLPPGRDAEAWFDSVAHLPGAVFLDSGCEGDHPNARRDVIAAQPQRVLTLSPQPDRAEVERFFSQLALHAGARCEQTQQFAASGLIGYVGYDAGLALHGVAPATAEAPLPAAWVGDYPWAVVCDRQTGRSELHWREDLDTAALERIREQLLRAPAGRTGFQVHGSFSANLDHGAYRNALERISGYIGAGDCYQVNLARRFEASCHGDSWTAYRALRRVARAPYSVFLCLEPGLELLCLSPERFLSLEDRHVSTSPIKGTRPRGEGAHSDAQLARELLASEKDRAENLMIVDLLRNDIGRSCDFGTVRCERLFELESYATVHHMVSTVTGRLRAGLTWVELFRDAFPGGSITGAPKRRAMQIIAELEPDARQAYCGSFFHAADSGHFDSNIAIRTLLRSGTKLACWGGGGIVADSSWEDEFRETEHKIGAFLARLVEGCEPQ